MAELMNKVRVAYGMAPLENTKSTDSEGHDGDQKQETIEEASKN